MLARWRSNLGRIAPTPPKCEHSESQCFEIASIVYLGFKAKCQHIGFESKCKSTLPREKQTLACWIRFDLMPRCVQQNAHDLIVGFMVECSNVGSSKCWHWESQCVGNANQNARGQDFNAREILAQFECILVVGWTIPAWSAFITNTSAKNPPPMARSKHRRNTLLDCVANATQFNPPHHPFACCLPFGHGTPSTLSALTLCVAFWTWITDVGNADHRMGAHVRSAFGYPFCPARSKTADVACGWYLHGVWYSNGCNHLLNQHQPNQETNLNNPMVVTTCWANICTLWRRLRWICIQTVAKPLQMLHCWKLAKHCAQNRLNKNYCKQLSLQQIMQRFMQLLLHAMLCNPCDITIQTTKQMRNSK